MRKVLSLMLCGLFTSFYLQAQSLDVVELGSIAGEMGIFESTLDWKNSSEDTLRIKLWSSRETLTFDKDSWLIVPGSSASIGYKIGLEETEGEETYEVRLIGDEEIVLHGFLLKARVFEAEEEIFRAYRNDFFPFRATGQVFNLKSGFRGDRLTQQYSLFNFGGKQLDMKKAITSMPGVTVSFEPEEVPHNSFSRITVSLQSNEEHNLGFTREKLQIMSPDSALIATVPLQFTLEEIPTKNTAGPHMSISRLRHDFRVVKQNEQKTVSITLTNSGRSILNVERVEANCDCLEFELGKQELEQGESTILTVTFNATDRIGYERKTLALFTNDPDQPTRVLTFKAHVK